MMTYASDMIKYYRKKIIFLLRIIRKRNYCVVFIFRTYFFSFTRKCMAANRHLHNLETVAWLLKIARISACFSHQDLSSQITEKPRFLDT